MNRTAQIFLGIAIAIVFPTFVFYASVTFLPSREYSAHTYIDYPDAPRNPANNSACQNIYSNKGVNVVSNPTQCAILREKYQKDLTVHKQDMAAYEQNIKDRDAKLKADRDYNDQIIVYRALLAIGFSLIGLGAILGVMGIPALVYGFASGAGITLLASITYLLSAQGTALHSLVAGILLGLFVVLVVLAMVFDRRFVAPIDSIEDTFVPEPVVLAPETTPVIDEPAAPQIAPAVVNPVTPTLAENATDEVADVSKDAEPTTPPTDAPADITSETEQIK